MGDTLPTGLVSVTSDFAAAAFDARMGRASALSDSTSGVLHCRYSKNYENEVDYTEYSAEDAAMFGFGFGYNPVVSPISPTLCF